MVVLAVSQSARCRVAADLVEQLAGLVQGCRPELTAKAKAAEIGITQATLTRLIGGSTPTQTTIVACLRWLAEH